MPIEIKYGQGALLDAIAADQSMRSAQRRREESRQDRNDLFRRAMERARLGLAYQDQALRRTQARQGMELDERRLGLQEQGIADTRDRAEAGIQQADRGLDLREKQLLEELQRTKSNDRYNREVQQRQFAQGDRSLDLRETGMYLGQEQAYQRAEQSGMSFQAGLIDDATRAVDRFITDNADPSEPITEEARGQMIRQEVNNRKRMLGLPYEGGLYHRREWMTGQETEYGRRIRMNKDTTDEQKMDLLNQLDHRESLVEEDHSTPQEQGSQLKDELTATTVKDDYGNILQRTEKGWEKVSEPPKELYKSLTSLYESGAKEGEGTVEFVDEILKADRKAASNVLGETGPTQTPKVETLSNADVPAVSRIQDAKTKNPTAAAGEVVAQGILQNKPGVMLAFDEDGNIIEKPIEPFVIPKPKRNGKELSAEDIFKSPIIQAKYKIETEKLDAENAPKEAYEVLMFDLLGKDRTITKDIQRSVDQAYAFGLMETILRPDGAANRALAKREIQEIWGSYKNFMGAVEGYVKDKYSEVEEVGARGRDAVQEQLNKGSDAIMRYFDTDISDTFD